MRQLFLFVAMVVCLFLCGSCSQQGDTWGGTIEEIDGVLIVKNPKEPLYGEEVFSLEEELSIGDTDESEDYLFSQIRHFTVDNMGRFFILDQQEAVIKVFDKEGNYLNKIGRKGQGPGEFNNPSMIYFLNNELLVMEFDRLSFFSPEGKFLRVIPTSKERAGRTRCDSNGNIVSVCSLFDPGESFTYSLKIFDKDFNLMKEITKVTIPLVPLTSNPFSPIVYMTVDAKDNIVFGYGKKYEIQIYNPEGNLAKKIMRAYDPVEVTEEEREKRREGLPEQIKLDFPSHHPAYYRFIHDDEGRLYVQSYEKTEKFNTYYHDVFNQDGRYIAKIPLKQFPVICQQGKLYSLEEDEDGYQFVKRYKISWSY